MTSLAISPGREFATTIPKQTLRKQRDCSVAASNSAVPDDRTRTAGGLPAPFEPDWRDLLPYRFDGEQLLGHSTHDARLRLRRTISRDRRVAHFSGIQWRFLHRRSRSPLGLRTTAS